MSSSDSGSDSGYSASSASSEDEQPEMLTLAQIYKKDGVRGDITPWNGREPGPDESIFVFCILDNDFLRRMVCDNLGDLLKLQVDKHDIDIRALYAQVATAYVPDKIGTYLKLPSYFPCYNQPRCLQECWLQVASFLPKLMSEGKIVMFHPRSGIQIPSTIYVPVGDYKPTFWLNLSGINYTYPHNTVETRRALKKHYDNGDELIRQLPPSEFKNPALYEVRREYVPSPLKRPNPFKLPNPFKHRKLGGGQHRGKSRRRLKRRNKRKTIKRRFKKR
jgi:hypothetical protein